MLRAGVRLSADGLHVEDPALVRKLDRPTWSPSGVDTWTSCPARWAFEHLIPEHPDPFAANSLGTSGHRVLELLYRMDPGCRTRDMAAAIIADLPAERGRLLVPGRMEDLLRWQVSVLDKIVGLWEVEDPAAVEVAATEQTLVSQVGAVPFRGVVDRVDRFVDEAGAAQVAIVDYKGLAVDTPLPTPSGWTTMGQVAVGDRVFGREGRAVTVTAKSGVHHRPCFEVTFEGGAGIIADNVHLWQVDDAAGRSMVVSTSQLAALVAARCEVRVPATQTLHGPELPGDLAAVAAAAVRSGVLDEAWSRASVGQRRELFERLLEATGGIHPAMPVLAATFGRGARRVTGVVPVESVPTQCIQVDAADSLYLAGWSMVPTHNTGKAPMPSRRGGSGDSKVAAMVAYHVAYQHLTGVTPARLDLLFTDTKQRVRYSPVASPAACKQVVAAWESTWADMKAGARQGRYGFKVSALCGWCPLATVCPAADARGRGVAKVAAGRTGEVLGIPTCSPATGVSAVDAPALPEAAAVEPADAGLVASSLVTTDLTLERTPLMAHPTFAGMVNTPAYTEVVDGKLNPASYAAGRLIDIQREAVYRLNLAGQPVTGQSLAAMTHLLGSFVEQLTAELFGRASWQDGGAHLVSRALGTALNARPVPFGATEAIWAEWRRRVHNMVVAEVNLAAELWTNGADENAWRAFATTAAPTEQPVPVVPAA